MSPRNTVVCVHFSSEEHERLKSVAAHYGLGRAEAIRFLLARDAERIETLQGQSRESP